MPNETKLTGYPSIDKPWLKYYSEEAINASLPECTIYEHLWENNKDHLDDIAIIYINRKITYGKLFRNIDKTAAALTAIGVKQGEIVTVAMPSIPEALYAVYALNKIGVVANMIHPLAGEQEICHYLNEVNSTVFLMFTGTYEIIKNALDKTGVKTAVVVSPSESLSFLAKCVYRIKTKEPAVKSRASLMDWKTFIEQGANADVQTVARSCHAMTLISHTGGTTGEPKGVMLSDDNINAIIHQLSNILPIVRQERQLAVLPPFINYSLVHGMLVTLACGNIVILVPKYESAHFAKYANKYKPNYISSIPPYWEELIRIDRKQLRDLSFLKYPFYGGEAMNADIENKVNEVLKECGAPNCLAKGLGATELVSAATLTPFGRNVKGSVGLPLPKINCKIVEPGTEKELGYNEEGEICFSGPTVMLGYYKNKSATDEIIKTHSDGVKWLHMGDLGHISKDGDVFVTGRLKRIMITRGSDGIMTKLFPDRIEQAIMTHPSVELCCVIGIPDQLRTNIPKAFVVLKTDCKESSALNEEILNTCRNILPDYMVPDAIEYRTELPRTNRGKIDYRALEKESTEEKSI